MRIRDLRQSGGWIESRRWLWDDTHPEVFLEMLGLFIQLRIDGWRKVNEVGGKRQSKNKCLYCVGGCWIDDSWIKMWMLL